VSWAVFKENTEPRDIGDLITVEEPVLQAEISRAVHKMSWDAQLWFPVVQRQLLALRTDAADEQIHDALLAMIENHALVPINPYLPYDWEIPISNSTSYPDPSLRRISTSADSQRCLQRALSSHDWMDEMPVPELDGRSKSLKQESAPIGLTYLESQIIVAIEHLGWFSFLWFPFVYRDDLNFGSNAPEGDVHRAVRCLVRKKPTSAILPFDP
jgi:hypothetical protein